MNKGPNPLSTASRLRGYFELNPDEELRRQDIVEKFSVDRSTVDYALRQLRRAGFLTKTTRTRIAYYHRPGSDA